MRPLRRHPPTADQLELIRDNDPGNVLVRGAAGSGKTTTALVRLELVTNYMLTRRRQQSSSEPVRVLALAFNRTLVGYISDLAHDRVPAGPMVKLEVNTIAGFNRAVAGFSGSVWDGPTRDDFIWSAGRHLGFSRHFLLDEVEYLIGRYPPGSFSDYVTSPIARLGRGRTPSVPMDMRQRILDEVIGPLVAYKNANTLVDWNDLAVIAAATPPAPGARWDVVVTDETQDFSVNQMRSVVTHLASEHSLTAVTDTAQRIYPRHLYYPEAGLPPFDRIYTLDRNFRNTPPIAALAASILDGLTLDDDGTLPAPGPTASSSAVAPETPVLLWGRYSDQLDWVIEDLKNRKINGSVSEDELEPETAAILTLRGGRFWRFTRSRLADAGLEWIELQRTKEWPDGEANLALSTLHSAKGLEFDHVYIIGLNDEFTEHDEGEDDATLDRWRRLLGMAVGRARRTVTLGSKHDDASRLIDHVDAVLVDVIDLEGE